MISINRGQSCTIAIRLSNPLLIGDIESMQCFHSSGNPWFQPGPFWEDGIAFIKLSSQETLTLEDSFYVYFVIQSLTKGQRVSKRIQVKASTVHTPGNSSVNQGVDFVIEFIDPDYRGIEAWMAGYVKGDRGDKGDKGDQGAPGQRGPKGSSVLRVDIAGDNLIFYFDGGLPPQSVVVPAIQAANAAAAAAAQSATDANASKLAAVQSALNAASSATVAQTSAQNSAQSASTATTKASEAANSATSANTSAQSASSSALAASSHKDDAESSAQNALSSANSAQDSANVAMQAKVDAIQAKNLTEVAKNAVDSAAAQVASDTQVATTKANEAAGSATNAEFFANNAEDHASAAFSSRVLAQNSANSASISEGNAASSAQSAASSATAAAQSAQDANNSELEAESAATLSTEQFTLVSAARNEAVAAKIAAQNSEDTATDAAATASAAATTATTQAGLAAAAAATINQVNFTGAQNGDLLMRQAGVFSRIPQANLGAIRELFRLAMPLNSYFNVKQIVAWDNADKTVPNGSALTTLDSGQSWQSFIGPHTIAYRQGPGELGIFRGTSTNATDNWSSVIPWGLGSIGIEWTHRRTTLGADSGVIIAARDTSNYLVFQRFMPEQFTGGLAADGTHRLISVVNGVGSVLATFNQGQIFGLTNNDDGFNLVPVTWIIKYGHLGRNNTSQILIFLKHNPAVRVELNVTSLNTVYASAANLAFTGLMGDSLAEGATTRYIVARLI